MNSRGKGTNWPTNVLEGGIATKFAASVILSDERARVARNCRRNDNNITYFRFSITARTGEKLIFRTRLRADGGKRDGKGTRPRRNCFYYHFIGSPFDEGGPAQKERTFRWWNRERSSSVTTVDSPTRILRDHGVVQFYGVVRKKFAKSSGKKEWKNNEKLFVLNSL